jgi:hypothetical protein
MEMLTAMTRRMNSAVRVEETSFDVTVVSVYHLVDDVITGLTVLMAAMNATVHTVGLATFTVSMTPLNVYAPVLVVTAGLTVLIFRMNSTVHAMPINFDVPMVSAFHLYIDVIIQLTVWMARMNLPVHVIQVSSSATRLVDAFLPVGTVTTIATVLTVVMILRIAQKSVHLVS